MKNPQLQVVVAGQRGVLVLNKRARVGFGWVQMSALVEAREIALEDIRIEAIVEEASSC